MNSWRWLGISIFLLATVCLIGIQQSAGQGADDKKVKVEAKPGSATVEAGKSETVTLTLTRGKELEKKEVVLTAEVETKEKDHGVTVDLDAAKVAADKKEAKATIKTTDKTPAGSYKINITAKADGAAEAAKATVELTVKKAEVAKTPDKTPPTTTGGQKSKFSAFDPEKQKKPFYTEQTTKTTQKMEVNKQTVTQEQMQTFLIKWTPKPMADKKWVVEQQIEGVKLKINIGGNNIDYDSTAKNPKNPMTDFFEQLTKQPLVYTINPDKIAVEKIEKRDEFIKGLSDINPQMRSLLTQILSDNALKKMAEPTWYAYPEDETFAKDKKWTRTSELDLGPIGKYKTDFDFTVKSIDGDKATIDIKTKLTYTAPTDDKKAGLPFVIKSANLTADSGTGTAVFDMKAGRFEKTDLEMKLKGTLTIEVGNMTTTVELDQTQKASSVTKDDKPGEWNPK